MTEKILIKDGPTLSDLSKQPDFRNKFQTFANFCFDRLAITLSTILLRLSCLNDLCMLQLPFVTSCTDCKINMRTQLERLFVRSDGILPVSLLLQ